MAIERDADLPPWLQIEREYDGDDEATTAAVVDLIRYANARDLAASIDRDAGLALAEEAGLNLDDHRAVCRDPAACWICGEDAAPKGAKQ